MEKMRNQIPFRSLFPGIAKTNTREIQLPNFHENNYARKIVGIRYNIPTLDQCYCVLAINQVESFIRILYQLNVKYLQLNKSRITLNKTFFHVVTEIKHKYSIRFFE